MKSYLAILATLILVPFLPIKGPIRVGNEPASTDPTFQRSPKGWLPHCPAGTDLIRHRPAPDCFWGTAPMSTKPTQGDFECVGVGMVQNLPACPVE